MSNITENQKKLSYQLNEYHSNIKKAYLGAVSVLCANDYPDKWVHFSHSLREVIDLIARKNDSNANSRGGPKRARKNDSNANSRGGPKRARKNDSNANSRGGPKRARKNDSNANSRGGPKRARKLEKVLDPIHTNHSVIKIQCNKLAEYYSDLSEIAHHNIDTNQNECKSRLAEIEKILLKLTMPQIEIMFQMDQIIRSHPSKKNVKALQEFLFRLSSEIYLLESLSPDWLPYLRDAGFFDCSNLEKRYDKDSPNFIWVPSKFLAICTKEKPDTVREIILGCNFKGTATHSWIAIIDFLDCAMNMSVSHATEIAKKSLDDKWHDSIYKWSSDKYADLAVRMYREGKYDLAIEMFHNLFKLKLQDTIPDSHTGMYDDVKPYIDKYVFEHILNEKIPILCNKESLRIAKLLADILEESIFLWANKCSDIEYQDDFSDIWRPAVEEHDQNWEHTPSSILVQHLRYCLEQMGKDKMDSLKDCMKHLETKQYYIFRRLEMHIYKKFANEFKESIEKSLLDYFDNGIVHHEYYNLIGETFDFTSETVQNKIISMIDKCFETKLKEIQQDEDIDLAKKRIGEWKWRMFEPISKYLDDEHKSQYSKLVAEFGTIPEHPEFERYISSSFEPSVVSGMFKEISSEQVFDAVKKHQINQDDFPTADPMATAFKEYVEKHPEYCSQHALEIKDGNPVFSYELLYGLENAVRANKDIDWNCTLKLVEYIIHQIANKKYPATPGYDPAVEICSLLKEGFDNKLIPFDMQEKILNIVIKLVEIGNTVPEQQYSFDDNMDSFTIAINSINGKSFEILYKYAIWCKQNNESGGLFSETKEILEAYLNDRTRHTVARNAMFGAHLLNLYYLDENWVKTIYDRIAKSRELKIAFWEGYLYNRVYKNVFEDLQSWYNEFLNGNILNGISRKTIRERTIQHTMLAYISDLDSAENIFLWFVRKSKNESANYWVGHLEYLISNYKDGMQINKDKIQKLLEGEMFIKKAMMVTWLKNKMFDEKYTINIFLDYLKRTDNVKINFLYVQVEDLQPYVKDYAVDVASCLKIISAKQRNKENSYVPPILESILESLLKIKNGEVTKICRKTIEDMVALGHTEYKKLLD